MLTKMVRMAIEQQQLDMRQKPNQVLNRKIVFLSSWFIEIRLPESATSLIFFPSVFAIKPITEKMTKPLIKQVPSLNAVRINVSLDKHKNFFRISFR